MAERLDIEMPAPARGGGPKYQWDEWFDGGVWRLARGEDFDVSIAAVRSAAQTAGRKRGLLIRSSVESETTLLIQAVER